MKAPGAFVQALAAVGLSIEDPWELVNMRQPYRDAVPVLVEWLDRADTEVPSGEREKFREALVRGLCVKEARGIAAGALLREFRRDGASSAYRWAVGNSLEVVADDSCFDELGAIALDAGFGTDRQMVVLALGRMNDPRAVDILTALLDDEAVVGHALTALGRLRVPSTRDAVACCLHHPLSWVRREAERALKQL